MALPDIGVLARLRIFEVSRLKKSLSREIDRDYRATLLPYRKDIDGLRSIAVLLVILFHFNLGDCFRAGFMGVDIFFVISGFLIGATLRLQISQGLFNPTTFYVRRIRRLAPALLATVAISLLAGCILLTPAELEKLGLEATTAQLYASNFYYWRFLSYFGIQAEQSPFLHTWSLGVEEQFYLFFPLMLWAVFRWHRNVVGALLLIGIASFALNIVGVLWKPEATFYLLPTRVWEFACGALVPEAIALSRRWQIPHGRIAAVGVLGLVLSLLCYREDILFPGWFAAAPTASTIVLLVAGSERDCWYSKLMSARAPVYLGKISYELYLIHWPVRVFAPLLVFDFSFAARFWCFLLCFPGASLIYHTLSAPIRHSKLLPSQRSALTAYITSTCAMLALATGAVLTGGFPSRINLNIRRFADGANDQSLAYRACEGRPIGKCRIGSSSQEPTWLIYGDSHADALAEAFGAFLEGRHEAAYFAFESGCLPVLGSGDLNCRKFNDDALQFLKFHPRVRFVGLVSTWRQPLEPRYTDASGVPVSGRAELVAFHQSLADTIGRNRAAGRQVVIWMPVPGARKPVPGTLVRNALLGRNWDIRFSRNEYDATFSFLFDDVVGKPGVILIRPARYICQSGECEILQGGRPLYHDAAHPAASQTSYFRHIIDAELGKSLSY